MVGVLLERDILSITLFNCSLTKIKHLFSEEL